MTESDAVREFLDARGCPDDVVAGGLEGLIAEWERTVGQVEQGYPLGLDDYLNDLDGRQLIEDTLEAVPEAGTAALTERARRADERMRASVRTVPECLWGARVAEVEGWSAAENWWYYAVPAAPGPQLVQDFEPTD